MHSEASVFLRKCEASGNLGKKTAVHVHSSGIWTPKYKMLEPILSTRSIKNAQRYMLFPRKSEISTSWGHKTVVHVHSIGIWRLKWTSPRAHCSPCEDYYCFSKPNEHQGVGLGAQVIGRDRNVPRTYLLFPQGKVRFLEFQRPMGSPLSGY